MEVNYISAQHMYQTHYIQEVRENMVERIVFNYQSVSDDDGFFIR